MKPRILFIAHRIPYPPNKGDKIRSFNELKYLSRLYTVDLITFLDDKFDKRYIHKLETFCDTIKVISINKPWALLKGLVFLLRGRSLAEGYYFSSKVRRYASSLVAKNNYKYVFCFSSQMGQFVIDEPVKKIMDFCDADSDKFRQYAEKARFPLSAVYRLESKRLREWELEVYERFDYSLIVTRSEAALFSNGKQLDKLHAMPNGIDCEFFKPMNVKKEFCIVFSGDMAYDANVDGAVWFGQNIFPDILEQMPELIFYIVGRNPTAEVINLGKNNSNIIVTGAVDDVRPYLAKSQIAVVPLRIARGIQNKVLEAMAMGIPVVIPDMLVKTLDNIREEDALVFSDEEECCSKIVALLNGPARLNDIGKNGLEYVKQNYNWDRNFSALNAGILN